MFRKCCVAGTFLGFDERSDVAVEIFMRSYEPRLLRDTELPTEMHKQEKQRSTVLY